MNKALPDDFKLQRKYVFQMVKTKIIKPKLGKTITFKWSEQNLLECILKHLLFECSEEKLNETNF